MMGGYSRIGEYHQWEESSWGGYLDRCGERELGSGIYRGLYCLSKTHISTVMTESSAMSIVV